MGLGRISARFGSSVSRRGIEIMAARPVAATINRSFGHARSFRAKEVISDAVSVAEADDDAFFSPSSSLNNGTGLQGMGCELCRGSDCSCTFEYSVCASTTRRQNSDWQRRHNGEKAEYGARQDYASTLMRSHVKRSNAEYQNLGFDHFMFSFYFASLKHVKKVLVLRVP